MSVGFYCLLLINYTEKKYSNVLDSHCIEMVKQGIDKQLISLLSRNNTDKGDMKLQHALLSALR